ncbi:MAG: hypothetical protein IPM31_04935 [Anaerolineae bacterium]|nr:hypothetical protein [Anaerolineae bacterium]
MTENPFAGFGFVRAFCHAAQAFLFGAHFAIDLLQRERILMQMQMRVGQPGDDDAPAHVLPFSAGEVVEQIIRFTHRDDSVAVNYEGGGFRL